MHFPSFSTIVLAACVLNSASAGFIGTRDTDYALARQARRLSSLTARQEESVDAKNKAINNKKDDNEEDENDKSPNPAAKNSNNNNAAVAAAAVAAAAKANSPSNANANNNAGALCLKTNAVQSGSALAGENAEAGQVASATDPSNFINFCSGKTLTNGLQVKGGSCNGVVMGDIPSSSNMVSTVIVSPQPAQQMKANEAFTISVQTKNLAAGAFTNPQSTYYSAPQTLRNGIVVGHTHVTVQNMGSSLSPTSPPDPSQFAFFKGINDAGNGNGLLSATVTGGLPAGNYRVCTLTSASNHQMVLMPVAQRGSQDDCTKFTVK